MSIIIIDIAILIAALYLLIVAIKMKKSGQIPKIVMGEDMKKLCKDEKGFIDAIYPALLIFSIVSLIAGAVGSVLDYLKFPSWTTMITSGVFLLVFVIFMIIYKRATKNYFEGL